MTTRRITYVRLDHPLNKVFMEWSDWMALKKYGTKVGLVEILYLTCLTFITFLSWIEVFWSHVFWLVTAIPLTAAFWAAAYLQYQYRKAIKAKEILSLPELVPFSTASALVDCNHALERSIRDTRNNYNRLIALLDHETLSDDQRARIREAARIVSQANWENVLVKDECKGLWGLTPKNEKIALSKLSLPVEHCVVRSRRCTELVDCCSEYVLHSASFTTDSTHAVIMEREIEREQATIAALIEVNAETSARALPEVASDDSSTIVHLREESLVNKRCDSERKDAKVSGYAYPDKVVYNDMDFYRH